MNILIADDHPLIRKGIKQILSDSPEITAVFEADSSFAVFNVLESRSIDILILDISLPGKDGMEILKDVKVYYPDLPVLMLSIQPEDQYALRAFKYGASGCLNKASAPEELLEALRKVKSGTRYINDAVSEILLNDLTGKNLENPHLNLSEREFQVMIMIAEGLTISTISDKLSLSIKTVSTYRTRLMAKMNLHNNAQLVYYAVKHNLLG
ncbi:MAG: response regulator transcription factor [Spirochaetia bacterium]|jgi:DNA-binding NarL/FixJ family response regulator|nr:response regulator transcription factor [Spirochaetia bacterium]